MTSRIIGYGSTGYPIYGNDDTPTGPRPQPTPTPAPVPSTPPAPPPLPAAPSPIDPAELAGMLYDKKIPVVLSDLIEVGGRVCEGPIKTVVDNENTLSFTCAYFLPANYWDNTRTITRLWFRGKEAWNTTAGVLLSGLNVGGATVGTEQRVRFNTGTLTQAADAWSVGLYGIDRAIAYIPLVTATFEFIRVAQFGNVLPFTSVTVEDTAYGNPGDGIPWADAMETMARYDGRSSDDFETQDISRRTLGIILADSIYYPDFLSGMRKLKPHWNILTGRKLKIVEKGVLSLDQTIELEHVLSRGPDPITIHGVDAFDKPRRMVANYINVERDFEADKTEAYEDTDPVQVTDSYASDEFNMPLVSSPSEMIADLNFAFYWNQMGRQTSEFSGTATYYGIEPGDALKYALDEGDVYHRVYEVTRNVDFTIDVKAEGFLTCAIAEVGDPDFAHCVFLMGADGTNGSTTVPDESASAHGNATIVGSPAISSTWAVFGSSLYIPTTGRADWPQSGDWHISSTNSDPFTIEARIYPLSVSGDRCIISRYSGAGGRGFIFGTSGTDLMWQWATGLSTSLITLTTTGIVLAINTSYAVCVSKNAAGKLRLFVDGVMYGSDTPADSSIAADPTTHLTVGSTALNQDQWVGYIDELRMYNGVCKRDDDAGYTVDTVKFPRRA